MFILIIKFCFSIVEFLELFQEIRGLSSPSDEIVLEDINLPGLAELKGRWRGSLDASGGGNGDTMVWFLRILL